MLCETHLAFLSRVMKKQLLEVSETYQPMSQNEIGKLPTLTFYKPKDPSQGRHILQKELIIRNIAPLATVG